MRCIDVLFFVCRIKFSLCRINNDIIFFLLYDRVGNLCLPNEIQWCRQPQAYKLTQLNNENHWFGIYAFLALEFPNSKRVFIRIILQNIRVRSPH